MLGRYIGGGALFEDWVDTFVGTRTRYLAIDLETGEVRYTLADLGETAGRRAIAAAGIAAADIDLVVMGTATPDSLMPATVNLIADRLGIDGVPTYQLQSGCTGAVQALDVACQMLLTGRNQTALVLGGDVCAKHVDLDIEFGSLAPAEMINALLFGDGVGALVVSSHPGIGSSILHRTLVRFVGLNRPPGQIVEWFGMGDRKSDKVAFREDYKAIEAQVPVMAREIYHELVDVQGWAESDVDYLLPPQLSVRMTEQIVRYMGASRAQEVSCIAETANAANALPFLQLEQVLPRMKPGDRAIAVAVESSKWIKAGFVFEMAG